MSHKWLCVRAEFEVRPDDWSRIHELFERSQCGGTVQSELPFAMWSYVYADMSAAARIEELRQLLHAEGATVTTCEVPDEEWSESWKRYFKPRLVGKRMVIVPSWEAEQANEWSDRISIEIDPGGAFGTGDHATTRLALELLEECVHPSCTVLDVGTGTGILAIAASKLGGTVIATEADSSAVAIARENIAKNQVNVTVIEAETLADTHSDYDVVVSNIFTAVLIRLAPEIAERVRETGVWIATGIIPCNFEDFRRAAEKCRLKVLNVREDEGWVAATLSRNATN